MDLFGARSAPGAAAHSINSEGRPFDLKERPPSHLARIGPV